MTPKEKAEELVNTYYKEIEIFTGNQEVHSRHFATTLALVTVDEIIPCTWKEATYKKMKYISVDERTTMEYWKQVKRELQKL